MTKCEIVFSKNLNILIVTLYQNECSDMYNDCKYNGFGEGVLFRFQSTYTFISLLLFIIVVCLKYTCMYISLLFLEDLEEFGYVQHHSNACFILALVA